MVLRVVMFVCTLQVNVTLLLGKPEVYGAGAAALGNSAKICIDKTFNFSK